MASFANDDSLAGGLGLEERNLKMFGLAIHGGAGTLPRLEMSIDLERLYRAGLAEAMNAGYAVLDGGGSSLDAGPRAVVRLEDNPLFNAGHGAVFTLDGQNELDASIMDGATLKAGAVCGVMHIKNPIEPARGDGGFGVRASQRLRRRGIRADSRLSVGAAKLFPYRRAMAAARTDP